MTTRAHLPLLPLVGLGAYLVAGIFYLFPSGTPQPADYLLLLTIVLTILFAWRRPPTDPRLYIAAGLFIAWITLVNATWFFLLPDYVFLTKTSFYLFNMLIFLFVIAVGNHDFERLRTVIWWACVLTLIFQLAYVELVYWGEGRRATGTFNNPNQLAYWTLLMMACLAVVKERTPLHVLDVLALGAGLYMTVLTQSRATSVAAAILVLMVVLVCRLDRRTGVLAAALLAAGLVFALVRGVPDVDVEDTAPITGLVERFEAAQDKEDTVWKRGYDRLFAHPHHLVLGAGEGAFARFAGEDDVARELHSSLGNLVLSYGVVGLLLFCALLYFVMAAAPWPSVAYFGPVMFYGMTHMGLRFSLFWVFLALVYTQARHYARGRRRRRRASRLPAFASPRRAAPASPLRARRRRLGVARRSAAKRG